MPSVTPSLRWQSLRHPSHPARRVKLEQVRIQERCKNEEQARIQSQLNQVRADSLAATTTTSGGGGSGGVAAGAEEARAMVSSSSSAEGGEEEGGGERGDEEESGEEKEQEPELEERAQ